MKIGNHLAAAWEDSQVPKKQGTGRSGEDSTKIFAKSPTLTALTAQAACRRNSFRQFHGQRRILKNANKFKHLRQQIIRMTMRSYEVPIWEVSTSVFYLGVSDQQWTNKNLITSTNNPLQVLGITYNSNSMVTRHDS